MTQNPDRYFVQMGDESPWIEVTKASYVDAERMAGFRNTMGRPDEPATAGFGANGVNGRLCYGGKHLPDSFIPLEEERMDKMTTPQEFHAELVKKFNQHCEAVRKGKEERYSFLRDKGIEYNGWLEHRHYWPITDDLLCGPALDSVDDLETDTVGLEVPFEDCDTCSKLVEMYRERCSKERSVQARERREMMEVEYE
jgi:hypothetical protein